MLLRGTGFIETNAGAGIGWACCDYERQDLTRPIVAYIWITPDSVEGATPPAPYFQKVTPGSGGIDVELRCSEAVDGFELSHSIIALPDLDLIQYSQSGDFHVTTEVQQYLFGRTVRTGKRSDWTPYGTSPAGFSPWEQVWNDSFSHYTGNTAYPGLSHVWGTGGDYVRVLVASPNRVCCHDYYNPQSLSIFGTSTGVLGSYWGARHQFKAYFNWYGDENAEELGVVFGARVAILTSYLTETYYVLAGRRKNATELYFRLYSVTGSTFTQLDISGNVHSYFPLLTTPYDIQITRTGDDFYVHKISTGEEVWHTTDDSIPPATTRIYTGVWMTGPHTPYLWDYWKIYRMVSGLDPVVVDPGHPYDGLQAAELTSAFGAGYRFLIEANNDVEDFCHYRVGDDPARQPSVAAYRWDSVAEDYVLEDERSLRLTADIVEMDYGGTGADLSAGGAVGDLLVADAATTMARLPGNTSATRKYLSQIGNGAVVTGTSWEEVDLSDYVTTAGLTAGTLPKASDTHALADSLITESGAAVSVEGDITLNADGVGENRAFTVEGWNTTTSAAVAWTMQVATDGDLRIAKAGSPRIHFTGTNSFFMGAAGNYTNTGQNNFACLTNALASLTSGSQSIAIGVNSLAYMQSNTNNIGIGNQALMNTNSATPGIGNSNIGIGGNAGLNNTDGYSNIFLGGGSGGSNIHGAYNIYCGTSAGAASSDVNFAVAIGFSANAAASNAFILGNNSTYAVNIGSGTNNPQAKIHLIKHSALTNTVQTMAIFGHCTSGTAANGFGAASVYQLESSTTADQDAAKIAWTWTDATHATRTSKLAFSVVTGAAALAEVFSLAGAAATVSVPLTVGVDDTGHDVVLFGATSGKKLLWDESENTLDVTGITTTDGRCLGVVTKTADYTATTFDDVIVANKATAITITLPAATGSGRRFIVKSIGVGACTIDGDSADTIDGAANVILGQWDSAQLIDYAANAWVII